MYPSSIMAESTPTTVAADSRTLTVNTDTTDDRGVRHVVIHTTATGNNQESYKAAERQAHEWFFHNYDETFGTPECLLQHLAAETRVAFAAKMLQSALEVGHVDQQWLDCAHPAILLDDGAYVFGHHCGINPTATEPTWGFEFEIVPMGGVKLN